MFGAQGLEGQIAKYAPRTLPFDNVQWAALPTNVRWAANFWLFLTTYGLTTYGGRLYLPMCIHALDAIIKLSLLTTDSHDTKPLAPSYHPYHINRPRQ